MNKFASWSLSAEKKEKCPKCGMANTGCCKDEKKQIKISLDQQKAEYNQTSPSFILALAHTPVSYKYVQAVTIATQNLFYLHSPPILLKQHTQATLSLFLI
jgi:hypothetical protein